MTKRKRERYVIEDSRTANCRPEDVIERILDPGSWPAWQPEIEATEGPARVSPGDVVRGHADMLGFAVEGHSTAVSVTRESFVEDVVVGVRMRIRYEVRPSGDANGGAGGAIVSHRLESELASGFSGRVLAFFLRRRLRIMQKRVLERLVAQAESAS